MVRNGPYWNNNNSNDKPLNSGSYLIRATTMDCGRGDGLWTIWIWQKIFDLLTMREEQQMPELLKLSYTSILMVKMAGNRISWSDFVKTYYFSCKINIEVLWILKKFTIITEKIMSKLHQNVLFFILFSVHQIIFEEKRAI